MKLILDLVVKHLQTCVLLLSKLSDKGYINKNYGKQIHNIADEIKKDFDM